MAGAALRGDLPTLVDDLANCAQVCHELSQASRVSVDIEGVDLSRTGTVCLIQIGTADGEVYLFDIVALGGAAFDEGGLRADVLENPGVLKLLYDARGDLDALHNIYAVDLVNMLDVQVLVNLRAAACRSQHSPLPQLVVGLKSVLGKRDVVPAQHVAEIKRIKEAGLALFDPRQGGSYEVWLERPLDDTLLQYAALDVVYLHGIVSKYTPDVLRYMRRRVPGVDWGSSGEEAALLRWLADVSGRRARRYAHADEEEWERRQGRNKAQRDFLEHCKYLSDCRKSAANDPAQILLGTS